jgi:hypothetical protein
VTREVAGRLVISCDRCNARLDLGPTNVQRHRPSRNPSGWVATGSNTHLCALCAPGTTGSFIRRFG